MCMERNTDAQNKNSRTIYIFTRMSVSDFILLIEYVVH
jgi:hypothetical protein